MPKFLLIACGAALLSMGLTTSALAAYGSADNPVGPTVSPYLNLLSTNQFGITNYQSLVRPLIDQGNAINRQGNTLNRLQQQMGGSGSGAGGYGRYNNGGATGHPTFFMNYSHFYPPSN